MTIPTVWSLDLVVGGLRVLVHGGSRSMFTVSRATGGIFELGV